MKIQTLMTVSVLCATGAFAGFTTSSTAAVIDSPSIALFGEKEQVSGTIIKADLDSNTFVLQTADDKTIEFSIGEDTKYFMDDKPATKEEVLKRGAKATVQHEAKNALRVNARST